jgi:hypothetical protein
MSSTTRNSSPDPQSRASIVSPARILLQPIAAPRMVAVGRDGEVDPGSHPHDVNNCLLSSTPIVLLMSMPSRCRGARTARAASIEPEGARTPGREVESRSGCRIGSPCSPATASTGVSEGTSSNASATYPQTPNAQGIDRSPSRSHCWLPGNRRIGGETS